jgi:hypothetical protein
MAGKLIDEVHELLAKAGVPPEDCGVILGPITGSFYERGRRDATREIAAYLLDRADQYPDGEPMWVAVSDTAMKVAHGEANEAAIHGELDDLYKRVDRWIGKKPDAK